MSDVSTWSSAAASNNSAAPDGFPEGMNPSDVNNSAREVMAAVKRWYDDIKDGTFEPDVITNLKYLAPVSAGTGAAYTVANMPASLTTNRIYTVRIHADNTGACTLAPGGGSAIDIKTIYGNDPIANQLWGGRIYDFLYDGTNLVPQNHELINLVKSVTTTADATNIDLSSLDINKHISYRVEIDALISGISGGAFLSLYANTDYTASNYTSETLNAEGSSLGSSHTLNATIGSTLDQPTLFTCFIRLVGGRYMCTSIMNSNRSSVLAGRTYINSVISNSTSLTNITALRLNSGNPNRILSGTKIRVYRE